MQVCRIIVNGAHGKMGRLAVEMLNTQPDFEVVAALGRADNLPETIRTTGAEVVVDLTCASAVYQNTLDIIKAGSCPVIGTSGLLPEQYITLKAFCDEKKLGGIIAPNFSIGAVLMMHFASVAAKYIPDVEIIEAHHPQKQEAPSGTAIKTAELIAQSRKSHTLAPSHELLAGARGAVSQGVPIHALRLPGTLAAQEVIFGQVGETLSIAHRTLDRVSFMPGLLLACQKVRGLSTLHYGLEHLLLVAEESKT